MCANSQHEALPTLAHPLKSAYLPLPPDFLFLPLSIALKACYVKKVTK